MKRDRALLTFMLVYGAASLTHFTHNAVYLEFSPNMPTWRNAGTAFALD